MSIEKNYNKMYGNHINKLTFCFEGDKLKENIEYERIEQLLNICFGTTFDHLDLAKNVSWLRTIFKDFDEHLLQVEISSPSRKVEVKYLNKELIAYYGTEKLGRGCKDLKVNYQVNYTPNNQIQFILSDEEGKIIEYPFYKNSLSLMEDSMKEIRALKRGNPVSLNDTGTALCEIYQLFYKETPDFSLEETKEKIQAMFSVLTEFNISLGNEFCFSTKDDKGLPLSQNLDFLIREYKPLGKVSLRQEPFLISENNKELVQTAGNIFKEMFGDNQEQEMIKKMSRVFYENRYKVPLEATPFILYRSNCSKDEVEKTIQYVKKVQEQVSHIQ